VSITFTTDNDEMVFTFEDEELETDDSDSEDVRHIVSPVGNEHIWRPGMEAQDVVDIAIVRGIEIVALCGYRWVPSSVVTQGLETCEICVDLMSKILNGEA
jgi:hypothetical protein